MSTTQQLRRATMSPTAVANNALGLNLATGFESEDTGGDWLVMVATTTDALTVVVTNDCGTAPAWDDTTTRVAVFTRGEWTDENGTGQRDPITLLDADGASSPETLDRVVRTALVQARTALGQYR